MNALPSRIVVAAMARGPTASTSRPCRRESAQHPSMKRQESLLNRIVKYLMDKENDEDDDPTARNLFEEVVEIFEGETTSPTLPSPLEATLIAIEKRLSAMENHQPQMEKKKTRSFAEAASTPHNSPAVEKAATHAEVKRISKTPKTVLLKNRNAKELIIQITDIRVKNELQKKSTKEIMNRLREKRDEIMRINRLTSGDIRAFTRSAEAKEDLQKNTN